jgi:hypothetical protein
MESFLIILMALLCTALPFAQGQKYGLVRLVSPMHLVAYFCFFGFLLKVVTYAFVPELAFFKRFVDNPWGNQLGVLYLSLFVLLLCAGYRFGCTSMVRADGITAARMVASGLTRRGALFTFAFAVSTVTIALILRARGVGGIDPGTLNALNSAKQINVNADGVGATLAGIKTLFIVPKFAFVMLLANGLATGARRVLVLASLLALLLILIALMSGDRFELVELFIFGLAVHMILGGRLNRRALGAGGAFFVLLAAMSAYMTQLRLGGGATTLAVLHQIVGSTYFLDINAAVMVTDRVRPDQMLVGQSYVWWSFGWVPRAFWLDKPAIDLGVFFKRDIMGVYTGGAFNVTGPGEAFMNFGWAGISVGFVLGWAYRKGEVLLLSSIAAIRHGAFLLYPMLFYPFVQATLQSSFSAFIVGAAAQFMLLALMICLFLPRYTLWISSRNKERSQLYVT